MPTRLDAFPHGVIEPSRGEVNLLALSESSSGHYNIRPSGSTLRLHSRIGDIAEPNVSRVHFSFVWTLSQSALHFSLAIMATW